MSDLADNDLQRMALTRLKARTDGAARGACQADQAARDRTELLRNTIDASQAEAIGAIDELSVKMRQREQKAQETFDRTLSAHLAPGAVDRRDASSASSCPPAS